VDHGRVVKKIFESKPEGRRRRMGRSRVRWLEDVEKDLRDVNIKRLGQTAVNREEWVPLTMETKAVRGLWGQGVV
jgi:hypothetical protein